MVEEAGRSRSRLVSSETEEVGSFHMSEGEESLEKPEMAVMGKLEDISVDWPLGARIVTTIVVWCGCKRRQLSWPICCPFNQTYEDSIQTAAEAGMTLLR